jgi:Rrf2 family protein
MDTGMNGVIKFTEAASLALHAMALLAADRDRRFQIQDIAGALRVSPSHLAKVLQRLAKIGLIRSVRGRAGGFVLARDPEAITALEIYEAVEGPLAIRQCLFPEPQCHGDCILGDTLAAASGLIRDKLSRTSLAELSAVFSGTPPGERQFRPAKVAGRR